ncbi:hypothetical protein Desdi_1638 [Desulfitobacterium dichloroeliminans LMG P-21439]|uniref:DUF456 domain-containing protein n=1 Tax=Desulfitobacterium dichloroeliminans (strain LMG P-21439 / DCA1) TaxID=871963 RepID=L0F7H3_DESDL|nr:DUF456 domain-containing protein [Desulfitobacterium dichloroeliminans]AGA69127.1 hypothetical protein Desdi_1638 [Desulfitobacterium dichloroeliminans LMG P-21439]
MATGALIIAIILFIVGLLGTVLPILPGAILIYVGMLIYGLMTGFTTLDFTFYLIQGLVFAFILLVDYWATVEGTRRFGGSKQAGWGAAIGLIVGLFFVPLGIVVGPFIGAVVAELLRKADLSQAIRVGFGTLVGLLGGTIIKLGVEILMIIYFFVRI